MKSHGTCLGIPYDLRPPTITRIKKRVWNKTTNKIFVPKIFGWGWTINWHALLKKIKIIH